MRSFPEKNIERTARRYFSSANGLDAFTEVGNTVEQQQAELLAMKSAGSKFTPPPRIERSITGMDLLETGQAIQSSPIRVLGESNASANKRDNF